VQAKYAIYDCLVVLVFFADSVDSVGWASGKGSDLLKNLHNYLAGAKCK